MHVTAHAVSTPYQSRPEIASSFILFAALVLGYFAYDYASYELPEAWGAAVVLALVAAIALVGLVNVRWGFTLFTVAVVFADDISRRDPLARDLQSLLTVPVAGVAVVNVLALALIALGALLLIFAFSEAPRAARLNRVDWCIVGILLVYGYAAVHGVRWWFVNPRGVINDLNLPLMLSGMYVLARWCLSTPEWTARFWRVLLAACGAKAMGWLVFFMLGQGLEFGTTLKVSNESGRVLLVLVFAWGLVLQGRVLLGGRAERLLGLLWVAVAGIGLLVQSQRGQWLMAAFAFLMLIAFGRLRDKLQWLVAGTMAALVIFAAVSFWKPEAFQTISNLFSTLRFWETTDLERSPSTMVRVYEFVNIHAQLVDHDELLTGAGPGATFSDNYYKYPFGISETEYSLPELQKREFQNAHGLFQNLMLNIGYGGMAAYLALVAVIYWTCLQLVRRPRDPYLQAIALTLLAFLPAMVYSSWSAKNNIILGILLGIAGGLWASRPHRSLAEADRDVAEANTTYSRG